MSQSLPRSAFTKGGPTSMLLHSRPCLNKPRESLAHSIRRPPFQGRSASFWTTEIYADEAAFTAHSESEVHAAATPIFAELIAQSEFMVGETLMAKGLDR